MAIVKMKRIRLVGILDERDELLSRLQSLGCLEVSEVSDEEIETLLTSRCESDIGKYREQNESLKSAVDVLNKYAPVKTGLFTPKKAVSEGEFLDEEEFSKALETAKLITANEVNITRIYSEIGQKKADIEYLLPWESMDMPLHVKATERTEVEHGTLSAESSYMSLESNVYALSDKAQLFKHSEDKTQMYISVVMMKECADEVRKVLTEAGFSKVEFPDKYGTPAENIAALKKAVEHLEKEKNSCIEEIKSQKSSRDRIQICCDRAAALIQKEETSTKLVQSGRIFALEGWIPVPDVKKAEKLFAEYTVAYELEDPVSPEDVPIKLKNNPITAPLAMVTNMYSLPAYDGIDPNPLIMPFFTIFFGIMYADMGYGIILTLLGIVGSILARKKESLKNVLGLLIMCGITTMISGLLFGSFFGDAIPVFTDLIGIEHKELWALINPLEQPMLMLIGSVVVGIIHILIGMGINAYMLVRDGKPLDALFDVGSWWLFFAGIAVGAVFGNWYVLIAGALALILTQGRHKPTIIGKIISGVASLYDVTSYLGDILSYTRLMALLLASSVIGSVVNVLGSLSGSLVVFIVVFIIGHLFNMGINIIGTYVHAARLQYLEFFGKFYKDGGRPFSPLTYKTKYTEIVKEEK